MAETISISESDGVAKLQDSLKRAQSGTVISLDTGTFPLDAPLVVPSGTTVQGAGSDQTVFTHEFDGPAIVIRHARNVRLTDFALNSRARGISRRALPEDPPAAGANAQNCINEWGLVFIDDGAAIDLERISLIGQREEKNLRAIVARDSTEISIVEAQIQSFGDDGISLFGTEEASVASCSVTNCLNGVSLGVMANGQRQSRAVLEGNRCHDNTQSGIVFFSSESDAVRDNDCWGNGGSGILLVRDESAPDQPSRAVLDGNRCFRNRVSFAIEIGSEARATGNIIFENREVDV